MKRWKKAFLVLLAAGLLFVICGWDYRLKTVVYTVESDEITTGLRIACITDLHCCSWGDGQRELLDAVDASAPDLVVLVGDILDHTMPLEQGYTVLEHLAENWPCYYVTGNHEVRVPGEYRQLKDGMEAAGVIVLENAKTQICLEGQAITVIGVDDPSHETEYPVGNSAGVIRKHLDMLQSDGDGFTLLLSHRPELFETYVDCGIDLVLSGHTHGGQIRLPFIGGLIAPGQGLFPEYDAGLFEEGNCRMIVSRGIGSSSFPFRFNNRPEIVLIELKTQSP